jgi:CxxC-x17-CxxC domain-containing protein
MNSNEFDNFGSAHGTALSEASEIQDKSILCIDCNNQFIWTVGEQVFFRDKGLQNPPKRCKECKQAKNERIAAITSAQALGVKQRIEVSVTCARCQSTTTVPFYPSQGRPVFCRSCFLEMNPHVLNGGQA